MRKQTAITNNSLNQVQNGPEVPIIIIHLCKLPVGGINYFPGNKCNLFNNESEV